MWTLYVVECTTPDRFYIGITQHIEKRSRKHYSGRSTAFIRKYGCRSVTVIAQFETEREAKRAEHEWLYRLRNSAQNEVIAGAGSTRADQ